MRAGEGRYLPVISVAQVITGGCLQSIPSHCQTSSPVHLLFAKVWSRWKTTKLIVCLIVHVSMCSVIESTFLTLRMRLTFNIFYDILYVSLSSIY